MNKQKLLETLTTERLTQPVTVYLKESEYKQLKLMVDSLNENNNGQKHSISKLIRNSCLAILGMTK